MTPEQVEESIAQLSYQPLTSPATGRLLYEFAAKEGVEEIVELGCAHGTSTAYLAAALDAKAAGLVRTFDREDAREREHAEIDVAHRLAQVQPGERRQQREALDRRGRDAQRGERSGGRFHEVDVVLAPRLAILRMTGP
jgi:predicted O-methyltransferase YrrM